MHHCDHHHQLEQKQKNQTDTVKVSGQETIGVRASPWGLTDISGEQWLFRELAPPTAPTEPYRKQLVCGQEVRAAAISSTASC